MVAIKVTVSSKIIPDYYLRTEIKTLWDKNFNSWFYALNI